MLYIALFTEKEYECQLLCRMKFYMGRMMEFLFIFKEALVNMIRKMDPASSLTNESSSYSKVLTTTHVVVSIPLRRALKLEKSLGPQNICVKGRNRGAFNFTPPVQNKIEDG